MLKLENVSKYYAKDGVITSGFTKANLELYLGEFVVITGESGSGKSTLLNVLSGLDSYEEGEMYINGLETSHYTETNYLDYRRKYVSNIFQNFNLVNSYTVYENILLTLLMNGESIRKSKRKVLELIKKVGLSKYKNTIVSKLSGGQKQRVGIARALANETPIIVCDEPTGSLDSKSSKEIINLLHEISKDKLVIIVTHNKEEIEKYATRLIRMHDGKILENRIIEKINLDNEIKEKEVKSITLLNKIYLGIKNAFNLPVKFTLMFIIFLLISMALLTNYGLFQATKYESNTIGYNEYFMNNSDKRIILKKNDKSIFNNTDYEKIKSIKEIEKIVENDLMLDYEIGIYTDNLYFYGIINTDNINDVDVGRLPNKDNEIVIKGSKNNWYLDSYGTEIFNEIFKLDLYNNSIIENIKVVGIIYEENTFNNDTFEFVLNNNLLDKISTKINENYYDITYKINDNYLNNEYYKLKISDKLNEGEILINSEINTYCKNYNCKNKILNINVSNIYVNDIVSFKIDKMYNQNNSKQLLKMKYEDINEYIFISETDYNKLFNRGNYQSSVFVKDIKDVDIVTRKLNDLGFNTFKLRDSLYNEGEEIYKILNIFELIVTLVLVITLFFISYFIIKIIYKSRNSYYTTLRTLGGTKKVCINILSNELMMFASITYLVFLIFISLVNKNIFKIEYFQEITKYIGIFEYILIYLILIVISLLISFRYGRKIFKNSIIKTYGERV